MRGPAVVHFDPIRGHIAIQPEDGKPAVVTLTDMGDATLHLWAFTGLALTPDTARHLATALQAWADLRTSERTPAS